MTTGNRARIVGFVDSTDLSCIRQQAVQIRRRFVGASRFKLLLTSHTDSSGGYEAGIRPTRSAEYKARVRWTPECDGATSQPDTILVRVKVTATPSDDPVAQGGFFRIYGSVRPAHRGSHVIVQRKASSGWIKVDKVRLTDGARYSVVLAVSWEGGRTFRVRWPAQHQDHEPNNSRAFTLHTS